jgi:hypothetical protein
MKTKYILFAAPALLFAAAANAQDDLYYTKQRRPAQEIDIKQNPAQPKPVETPAAITSAAAGNDDADDARSSAWSDSPSYDDNTIYEITENPSNSEYAQNNSGGTRSDAASYAERLRFEDPTYVVIYRDDWARDPWAWDYYSWRYPYYGWHGYYGSGWSWGLGNGWWVLSPLWRGSYYGWLYPYYYPYYHHHHHSYPHYSPPRNVTHNPRTGGTNNHSGYVRSGNSGRSAAINYSPRSDNRQNYTRSAPNYGYSSQRAASSARSDYSGNSTYSAPQSSSSGSSYSPRSSGGYGGQSSSSTSAGGTGGGRRPSSGR